MSVLSLSVLVHACAEPEPAEVVEPVYSDPCHFFPADGCSNNGECHGNELGEPICLCKVGYGSSNCGVCEEGFHLDSRALCVTDRLCSEQPSDPCGADGECVNMSGVLSCDCEKGYGGPRCSLCANGYARASDGKCAPDTRGPKSLDGGRAASQTERDATASDGDASGSSMDGGSASEAGSKPGPAVCTSQQTTTLGFEGLNGWSSDVDQCNSSAELKLPEVTLRSRVGSPAAYVWRCGSSSKTSLGMSTQYVVLEAGPMQVAQIVLPYGASSLRFDYAAPESAPLALDMLVDDAVVRTVEAASLAKGAVALDFGKPTSTISLRSRSAYRQNIAIDNLEYKYQKCE